MRLGLRARSCRAPTSLLRAHASRETEVICCEKHSRLGFLIVARCVYVICRSWRGDGTESKEGAIPSKRMSNCEQERFDFVQRRDGQAAAYAFALQSYRQYRTGLYGKDRMQNPDYREGWLQSALAFREILNAR